MIDAGVNCWASKIFAEKCSFGQGFVKYTVVVFLAMDACADLSKLQAAIFEAMPRIRSFSRNDLASEDFSARKTSPYGEVHRIVLLSPETIEHLNCTLSSNLVGKDVDHSEENL